MAYAEKRQRAIYQFESKLPYASQYNGSCVELLVKGDICHKVAVDMPDGRRRTFAAFTGELSNPAALTYGSMS